MCTGPERSRVLPEASRHIQAYGAAVHGEDTRALVGAVCGVHRLLLRLPVFAEAWRLAFQDALNAEDRATARRLWHANRDANPEGTNSVVSVVDHIAYNRPTPSPDFVRFILALKDVCPAVHKPLMRHPFRMLVLPPLCELVMDFNFPPPVVSEVLRTVKFAAQFNVKRAVERAHHNMALGGTELEHGTMGVILDNATRLRFSFEGTNLVHDCATSPCLSTGDVLAAMLLLATGHKNLLAQVRDPALGSVPILVAAMFTAAAGQEPHARKLFDTLLEALDGPVSQTLVGYVRELFTGVEHMDMRITGVCKTKVDLVMFAAYLGNAALLKRVRENKFLSDPGPWATDGCDCEAKGCSNISQLGMFIQNSTDPHAVIDAIHRSNMAADGDAVVRALEHHKSDIADGMRVAEACIERGGRLPSGREISRITRASVPPGEHGYSQDWFKNALLAGNTTVIGFLIKSGIHSHLLEQRWPRYEGDQLFSDVTPEVWKWVRQWDKAGVPAAGAICTLMGHNSGLPAAAYWTKPLHAPGITPDVITDVVWATLLVAARLDKNSATNRLCARLPTELWLLILHNAAMDLWKGRAWKFVPFDT